MGPLQVGKTLSQKYKIVRLLAESGGVVLYEATDTARAQRVWIKIMQREALNNAAALARFQREAGGAKVLDVGKNEAGLPYMVATEFGADKATPPPVPGKQKTTIPGVAPPPPPLKVDDDEPPPSSSIPVSSDDLEVVEEPTPALPSVMVSPLLAPPKDAALSSPLITTPPPKYEEEREREAPKPALVATIPPARKPASATPTVFIDRKRSNPTLTWLASLIIIASITGIIGYTLGHKEPAPPQTATTVTKEEPAVTQTAAAAPAQAETSTAAQSTPPVSVAASTSETPAPPTVATSTVATSAPTVPTVTAAPPATPTQARTQPPPRPRKPPPSATHASSDPLTL